MELPSEGYPIWLEAVTNWFRSRFGREPTTEELGDAMLRMSKRDATAPRAGDGHAPAGVAPANRPAPAPMPKEIGGPTGPEPTRYGDWERNGRCTDF
jgi:hypothetical protein